MAKANAPISNPHSGAISLLGKDLPTRLGKMSPALRAASLIHGHATLNFGMPMRAKTFFSTVDRTHRLSPELREMVNGMFGVRKDVLQAMRVITEPLFKDFAIGQLTGMDLGILTFGQTMQKTSGKRAVPKVVLSAWQAACADLTTEAMSSAILILRRFEITFKQPALPLKPNGDSYSDEDLMQMNRLPDLTA